MKCRKPKAAKHSKVVVAANRNIDHAVHTVVANPAQVAIVVVTEAQIVAIVLHVLQQVPEVAKNHGATVKGATEAAVLQVEVATVTAEAQAEVTRKDIKIESILYRPFRSKQRGRLIYKLIKDNSKTGYPFFEISMYEITICDDIKLKKLEINI